MHIESSADLDKGNFSLKNIVRLNPTFSESLLCLLSSETAQIIDIW